MSLNLISPSEMLKRGIGQKLDHPVTDCFHYPRAKALKGIVGASELGGTPEAGRYLVILLAQCAVSVDW